MPCLQLLACEDMGISLDDLKQYASAEVRAICCWLHLRSTAQGTLHLKACLAMRSPPCLQQAACRINNLALCIPQLPGDACWPLRACKP